MNFRRSAKLVASLSLVIITAGVYHLVGNAPRSAVPIGATTNSVLISADAVSPATTPASPPKAKVTPKTKVTPTTVTPTKVTMTTAIPVVAKVIPSTGPVAEGKAAMALLHYPFADLGYSLQFQGPLDGYLGLTNCTTKEITIYVEPSQTVAQVAYITAFEMAHAVDCVRNTATTRAAWESIRGFRGTWFPNCACSENDFGSGDFSDTFATWQVGHVYPWRSAIAPPSAEELQALLPYLSVRAA